MSTPTDWLDRMIAEGDEYEATKRQRTTEPGRFVNGLSLRAWWWRLYYALHGNIYRLYRLRSWLWHQLLRGRLFERLWCRVRHGYDPRDLWGLDVALARWLLPRLRGLRRYTLDPHGDGVAVQYYPDPDDVRGYATQQARAADRMALVINALSLIVDDDSRTSEEEIANNERIDEGLRIMAEDVRGWWT